MNIRRGMIRLWIVLTVFWVLIQINNNMQGVGLSDWRLAVWIYVIPPIAFAVVVTALGWVLSGFRPSD